MKWAGYRIGEEHVKPTQDLLANEYEKLTKCVQETIKELVPEKKWLKKNGTVVTQATRDLFEKNNHNNILG